jgi:hypothetical protein
MPVSVRCIVHELLHHIVGLTHLAGAVVGR